MKCSRVLLTLIAIMGLMPASVSASGPALSWFLWEEILEAPNEGMLALNPDGRTFEVLVDVNIDYWVQNDDGTLGQYLGHAGTGAGMQPCYANADAESSGLGNAVSTGLGGLIGDILAQQIAERTATAAREAAQNARPLNPLRQFGNAYHGVSSWGSHALWRAIGIAGGIA